MRVVSVRPMRMGLVKVCRRMHVAQRNVSVRSMRMCRCVSVWKGSVAMRRWDVRMSRRMEMPRGVRVKIWYVCVRPMRV